MIKYHTDFIISNDNEMAEIEIAPVSSIQYYYSGKIISSRFSEELVYNIKECNACIDEFSLSLVDEFVEKIHSYNLILKLNQLKIFNPRFSEDLTTLFFFIKYPTSAGFVDDYGWKK